MVRTWGFSAAQAVVTPTVGVSVLEANVTQRTAHVHLEVVNRGTQPALIEVGTFIMTLPDGTEVEGKADFLGRALRATHGTLATWGLTDAPERPMVPAGEAVEIKVAFRHPRRDLRRQGRLTVSLAAIQFNGTTLASETLVLVAPAEAPTGEDI